MIEIDMGAVMVELPAGTVTLLLADVEGSTRLWERSPDAMGDAVALLDETLIAAVAAHHGVRPLEQGEGDSFVIAFARAADAIACALTLQRTDLGPIALRIGIHTGDIQLRDQNNYVGPTINRTARIRDLGHGGQTLISGTTESLVIDTLPDGATLTDLGPHTLRDLPRPERVVQLGHPELRTDFPPLRIAGSVAAHNVPKQLTTFIGRGREVAELRTALSQHRLVTITGVGGAGKTRLAIRLANELAAEFEDGAWFVDLAPVAAPELLEPTVAAAFGLPDEPGVGTLDASIRFVRDRRLLLVLDNCEHLVDACAAMIDQLMSVADELTVLTTSREPVGVAGEVCWRMPSLSLADEAVELFVERARRVRADFALTEDNAGTVAEICRRLDGLPLAIELAAARVRALSLEGLSDSLNDRFRLLTGGSRTAVRRQQTLRASVDWSHAMLSDEERALFRKLGVFVGGFDLTAAQHVAGGGERYQMLDQLTLLVDKSLVVADDVGPDTRYRLLETMRQYALEKLGESDDAIEVRNRHCDHYLTVAAGLEGPADALYEQRLARAEVELDNFRAALGWCVENGEFDRALTLASSLQPLWYSRSHRREGDAWFQWVFELDGSRFTPDVEARALADKAALEMWSDAAAGHEHAQRALALARNTGDRALLLRALTACSFIVGYDFDRAKTAELFDEALALARELEDPFRLCQLLTRQAGIAVITGDLTTVSAAAEEARVLADAIGDTVDSWECQGYSGWALMMQGEVRESADRFARLATDEQMMSQMFLWPGAFQGWATALAYLGDVERAREVAHQLIDAASDGAEYFTGMGYAALGVAHLVDGDVQGAADATDLAWQYLGVQHRMAVVQRAFGSGVVALVTGDLEAAARYADESIAVASGWHLALAQIIRGRVAIAADDWAMAERRLFDGLAGVVDTGAYSWLPEVVDCLAAVEEHDARAERAARLLGAAEAIRHRTGMVRFGVYRSEYDATVAALRDAMSPEDFQAAWAQGEAMSTEEAIAYAQRGRGERKRPDSGWGALTPAERDVVKLVAEGLTNKDVAGRLFISPRTVQSHLAHVFTKLGVTTRTQLAQVATARRPTGAG